MLGKRALEAMGSEGPTRCVVARTTSTVASGFPEGAFIWLFKESGIGAHMLPFIWYNMRRWTGYASALLRTCKTVMNMKVSTKHGHFVSLGYKAFSQAEIINKAGWRAEYQRNKHYKWVKIQLLQLTTALHEVLDKRFEAADDWWNTFEKATIRTVKICNDHFGDRNYGLFALPIWKGHNEAPFYCDPIGKHIKFCTGPKEELHDRMGLLDIVERHPQTFDWRGCIAGYSQLSDIRYPRITYKPVCKGCSDIGCEVCKDRFYELRH